MLRAPSRWPRSLAIPGVAVRLSSRLASKPTSLVQVDFLFIPSLCHCHDVASGTRCLISYDPLNCGPASNTHGPRPYFPNRLSHPPLGRRPDSTNRSTRDRTSPRRSSPSFHRTLRIGVPQSATRVYLLPQRSCNLQPKRHCQSCTATVLTESAAIQSRHLFGASITTHLDTRIASPCLDVRSASKARSKDSLPNRVYVPSPRCSSPCFSSWPRCQVPQRWWYIASRQAKPSYPRTQPPRTPRRLVNLRPRIPHNTTDTQDAPHRAFCALCLPAAAALRLCPVQHAGRAHHSCVIRDEPQRSQL